MAGDGQPWTIPVPAEHQGDLCVQWGAEVPTRFAGGTLVNAAVVGWHLSQGENPHSWPSSPMAQPAGEADDAGDSAPLAATGMSPWSPGSS